MSTVHGGDEGHISTSSAERLVYMANQIAQFFGSQKHEAAVAGIADHIGKFWDPRMRSMIFAHLDAGGAGLKPAAIEALTRLQEKAREKAAS